MAVPAVFFHTELIAPAKPAPTRLAGVLRDITTLALLLLFALSPLALRLWLLLQ